MTRMRLLILAIGVLLAACAGTNEPESSIFLDVGETRSALVSAHCGYRWLEVDINGQTWRTDGLAADDTGNPQEPTWPRPGGPIVLTLHLLDDATLEVRTAGSDVVHSYVPDPSPPGCS